MECCGVPLNHGKAKTRRPNLKVIVAPQFPLLELRGMKEDKTSLPF